MMVRLKVTTLNQQVKAMSQGGLDTREDELKIQIILELIFQSLKVS